MTDCDLPLSNACSDATPTTDISFDFDGSFPIAQIFAQSRIERALHCCRKLFAPIGFAQQLETVLADRLGRDGFLVA